MLRSFLLGKLGFSILASLIVGAICTTQPWRQEYTFNQSLSWIGIGVFFLVLGVMQLAAVYYLLRKKR